MFVRESRYRAKEWECLRLRAELEAFIVLHNSLISRINAKGGEAFLSSDPTACQFDKDELREILTLCHPDRHSGSKLAEKISKRVNEIRQLK